MQLKFRNCGYKRVDTGTVVKLAVNPQFIRSRVLSKDEWDIFQRVLGGFARTYTEQQAVSREELDSAPAIKATDFSLFENSLWAVMYTVSLLTSEGVKSKIKALRGQFDVMFGFYQQAAYLTWRSLMITLFVNVDCGWDRRSIFYSTPTTKRWKCCRHSGNTTTLVTRIGPLLSNALHR